MTYTQIGAKNEPRNFSNNAHLSLTPNTIEYCYLPAH